MDIFQMSPCPQQAMQFNDLRQNVFVQIERWQLQLRLFWRSSIKTFWLNFDNRNNIDVY